MAANSPGQQLNDLLVTRNFDPEALDARTGKPPLDAQGAPDPDAANMFTFDWVADSGKNYGTVVCLLGTDNNFEIYFGDNLGRGMEFDDKSNWYEFLDQLRNFAKRNLLRYDLQNLRRLKYTMAGMAAIKEGLFEGYYGNRKVSYAGEPTQARLMIKHDRALGENDARFRHVDSLFIETVAGERFRLPFKKLAGGRAMLEHVRHGGTPYDARGQHIVEMVEQINVLSQFRRAHQGRVFEGAAGELVAETTEYLNRLRHNLKAVSHDRGYTQYFESWSPATVSESDLIVEDLKSLFVETRIDPRIEQALPMLARIQKEARAMKEADIFESWANRILEGTWELPDTPEQQDKLKMLMSQPLTAGADGMNATEQLYDLVGDDVLFDIVNDIADIDPDANIWDDKRVQDRLEQLGVYMVTPAEPAQAAETPPVAPQPGVAEGHQAPAPGWYVTHELRSGDPDIVKGPFASQQQAQMWMNGNIPDADDPAERYEITQMLEGDNLATFEQAGCNQTMEGEYCPEHGLAECGGMYESELAKLKSLANVEEGWKSELAGGTLGGVVGTVAGSALGALAGGGPLGAAAGGVLGGAFGGTAGQMAGREWSKDSKEKQLNEIAPLLAAGARAVMPLLSKVGPALGRMASGAGKAGAEVAGKTAAGIGRGTADVAKSAAQSAAQNAGQIGLGVGAYQAITDVADKMVGGVGEVYRDVGQAAGAISQAVGDSIDGKTLAELAGAAVKYAIPIGILLAVLYGGKKLIDQVMSEDIRGIASGGVAGAMTGGALGGMAANALGAPEELGKAAGTAIGGLAGAVLGNELTGPDKPADPAKPANPAKPKGVKETTALQGQYGHSGKLQKFDGNDPLTRLRQLAHGK